MVNLVGLRVLIFAIQEVSQPGEYQDYHHVATAVLVFAFFLHGVVFVWQAVGVFRAGEAYIKHHGAIASHWGAQLCVIIAFWLTVSYALSAWQMTIDVPEFRSYADKMELDRASKYRIALEGDGIVLIKGTLELGVTKRLVAILADDAGIREIILSSEGGNIYEARGLARIFREKGLATTVADQCSSACTTAFIGGKERQLKSGGRLGFHQYRIEADYVVLGADPKGEESKDRGLYLAAGVKGSFISRMHSATPEDMWYPDPKELLEAGVITSIAD